MCSRSRAVRRPGELGPGSPPDSALEAMGPVLESVLGSLTQEYEKRLFSKDHEVKGAQVRACSKAELVGLSVHRRA